jgi:DNA-binding CsgD family transcriptional regulator
LRGRRKRDDVLTAREWQVLELLRGGLTNEEIAERLGISLSTAKYHVAEILGKLNASSRHEAVRIADERPRSAAPMFLPSSILTLQMKLLVALFLVGAVSSVSILFLVRTGQGTDVSTAEPEVLTDESVSERILAESLASPFPHSILLAKEDPENVGDSSNVLKSIPVVRTLDELRAALRPDVNLVIVDRSAVSEVTGTSFLDEQLRLGRAVIELNSCPSGPTGSAHEGSITEIGPTGQRLNFSALGDRPCGFGSSPDSGFFRLRPGFERGGSAIAVGSGHGAYVRFNYGLFELAVRVLDERPTFDVTTNACDEARRLKADSAVEVLC